MKKAGYKQNPDVASPFIARAPAIFHLDGARAMNVW